MAKNEEQLLDYSRGLSRKSKKPMEKGSNFPPMESPDSGGADASSSNWAAEAAPTKAKGAPP
eukprot:1168609-Karenia_brevis.AAC.1